MTENKMNHRLKHSTSESFNLSGFLSDRKLNMTGRMNQQTDSSDKHKMNWQTNSFDINKVNQQIDSLVKISKAG